MVASGTHMFYWSCCAVTGSVTTHGSDIGAIYSYIQLAWLIRYGTNQHTRSNDSLSRPTTIRHL